MSKFSLLIETMHQLVQDPKYAVHLKGVDEHFKKRTYFRSAFAFTEGAIWLLKQACLDEFQYDSKNYNLSEEEKKVLFETKSGTPEGKQIFPRLKDNLYHTISIVGRLAKDESLTINKESEPEWALFTQSIKIRDRLVHPKSAADFEVSDSELEKMLNFTKWFHLLVMKCTLAVQSFTHHKN